MIRLMIGRDLKALYIPPAATTAGRRLRHRRARDLRLPRCPRPLAIRRGEILGLAGLVGAGRTALARTLFGIDRARARAVRCMAKRSTIRSPRDAIAHGIYLVPEDRKRAGSSWTCRRCRMSRWPSLRRFARLLLIDRRSEDEVLARTRPALDQGPHLRPRRRSRFRAATSKRSCWRNGCRCSRA